MNLDKLINVMEPMKSLLPFGSAEIEAQLKIWEHIWAENLEKCVSVPETAIDSLAECNEDLMPAVFRILKICNTTDHDCNQRKELFYLKASKNIIEKYDGRGEINRSCVNFNP